MTGVPFRRGNSHDIASIMMGQGWEGRPTGPTVSVRVSHMASGLDRLCGLPVPRQQLIESIDKMSIDHALEHIAQVGVGFDVIHFGSFDQRAERRPARSAIIRSGEQMILSTEGNLAVILPISGRML